MKKIFIIIILIVIILIAMGIGLLIILKHLAQEPNGSNLPLPEPTAGFFSSFAKPTQEPDTIMTLMGTITKVFPGEKKFSLRAEAVRNLFLIDKDFEILVDDATKIRFTKSVNGQDGSLPFSEIQKGQNVIILCVENARNKSSVLATGIDIVDGPATPFITGRTVSK